jgi:multicomponent Na+:H+ antiporter subunit F
VITATYIVLVAATAAFGYRLAVGPSLADRVVGVNGMLCVGMVAISAYAADTGNGAFLPVLGVIALVGFVGTAIIARFIQGRGR